MPFQSDNNTTLQMSVTNSHLKFSSSSFFFLSRPLNFELNTPIFSKSSNWQIVRTCLAISTLQELHQYRHFHKQFWTLFLQIVLGQIFVRPGQHFLGTVPFVKQFVPCRLQKRFLKLSSLLLWLGEYSQRCLCLLQFLSLLTMVHECRNHERCWSPKLAFILNVSCDFPSRWNQRNEHLRQLIRIMSSELPLDGFDESLCDGFIDVRGCGYRIRSHLLSY